MYIYIYNVCKVETYYQGPGHPNQNKKWSKAASWSRVPKMDVDKKNPFAAPFHAIPEFTATGTLLDLKKPSATYSHRLENKRREIQQHPSGT